MPYQSALAHRLGFEPGTSWLRDHCSTTEPSCLLELGDLLIMNDLLIMWFLVIMHSANYLGLKQHYHCSLKPHCNTHRYLCPLHSKQCLISACWSPMIPFFLVTESWFYEITTCDLSVTLQRAIPPWPNSCRPALIYYYFKKPLLWRYAKVQFVNVKIGVCAGRLRFILLVYVPNLAYPLHLGIWWLAKTITLHSSALQWNYMKVPWNSSPSITIFSLSLFLSLSLSLAIPFHFWCLSVSPPLSLSLSVSHPSPFHPVSFCLNLSLFLFLSLSTSLHLYPPPPPHPLLSLFLFLFCRLSMFIIHFPRQYLICICTRA